MQRTFSSITVGDSAESAHEMTEKLIRDFAAVTGDNNPIHLDAEYASTTVFKKPIAHGFLYGSFISKILGTEFPGEGTIYAAQSMKFHHPVYVGDTLTVTVTVTEKIVPNRLLLTTNITNQDAKLVLSGEASVTVPVEGE